MKLVCQLFPETDRFKISLASGYQDARPLALRRVALRGDFHRIETWFRVRETSLEKTGYRSAEKRTDTGHLYPVSLT